ncbi:AAA domain-containing protein [uncultured Fibrobacter sp.]|uniref:DEAD/DEAH box helicase n=1 Tax=uncultured Fibrobacter sp. TaxID=261512 RepID=UPI0025E3BC41|nr:AAA domain-containing protein [uncultured Fibrobacter sp.]
MDVAEIETIPFYENISARACNGVDANKIKLGLCTILPNPLQHNYIIQMDNDSVEFEFKNKQDKANIDAHFCRGNAHICNVRALTDAGFIFDLYVFAGRVLNFGETTILAEDENIERLRNKKSPESSDKLRERLADWCSVKIKGQTHFIMQGNYSASKEDDDSEKPDLDEEDGGEKEILGAFSILCHRFGHCFALKIQQKKLSASGNEKYFAVTGVASRKNIHPAANFYLVKANLTFSDERKVASEYNIEKLKALTEKTGSYLKAWRNYTGARGDRIMAQARKFGARHYISRMSKSENSVVLYFEGNIAEDVSRYMIEEIVLYDNTTPYPMFLENTTCDFLDYCEHLKQLKKIRDAANQKRWRGEEVPENDVLELCCPIISYEENSIEIRIPERKNNKSVNDIPINGYIVMSMTGEESQIARQQDAWSKIAEGKSGINFLGNILEGSFDYIPTGNLPKKVSISNRIREKIFKNPPTDRQLEAIDAALNTPEIVLVQGPPGTGKTTVITAVLEVLNELQDKRGVCAGRVLATSFQHDAVENMIERIRVNSLPTWKYGKRQGSSESYNDHIGKWCDSVVDRVLESNPELHISHEDETFNAYVAEYVHTPLTENKTRLLEYIQLLPIPEEYASRARKLLKGSAQERESKGTKGLLRKVNALRVTENSYADDGAKRVEDLYFGLEDSGWFLEHEAEQSLLMDLVMGGTPQKEQLDALAKMKKDLLEEFSPRPAHIAVKIDRDVQALCTEISQLLHSRREKQSKKEQILADWVDALRIGQESFAKAIKDCNFVYAATSQQSVGKEINRQKRAVEENNSQYITLYDTVIVDEAARATPPDLLIPMCKAVKRIILVGDHRQLPQLVDDDLCNEVYDALKNNDKSAEEESSVGTKDLLSTYEDAFELSLFELLFKKLKDLEERDGRKRTITLDKQYRTHPVLGKFGSRLFYEPYGEGYESPRPAEDFAHDLPGIENKAAVWIDVPPEAGAEKRQGSSRIRECEADCIVEKFLEFVRFQQDVPKEKKLTLGIIAFYSAQRDLIQSKLREHKEELKDVSYKIGTVDAFQGMEFDVVFLSIVRSKGAIDFLTPNRLCVSMSRQKRVLIAVGCAKFATSDAARSQKIPALSEYYDLCNGKNDEGFGAVLTWKR